MNERLKALVEQRVIEAATKKMTVKLNSIVRNLGKPIIAHSVFDNYLPDVWALPDEDIAYNPTEILEADDWTESEQGYAFDGLKFGINLCIYSLLYDDKISELKTTYNGYLVYAEIEGNLKAYAPFPAWEKAVDMFYEGSLETEKKRKAQEREEQLKERKKRFANFWKSFRMLWGVD